MPKQRIQRTIDSEPAVKFGVVREETTESLAPPAQVEIGPPTGLVLATSSGTSTAAPTAVISATWVQPAGYTPDYYAVEIDEANTFPAATTRKFTTAGSQPSIAIPNLKVATTYYVRVAAKRNGRQSPWTATASTTSASDTTPAAQVTSLAGTWIGTGDLLITWVNPSSANFKDAEITIKASSGGAQLGPLRYSSNGQFLYTAAMNLQDTSGAGDPSLYVEVRSRTFSNLVNNTSVPTLTTTKAAPNAPTVTHSWSGDTGTAGADLTFNLSAVADAARYKIALNAGTAREIGTTYTYTLDANIAQNGSADPTIGYSVTAVDGLGQSSTATTGTATNAAPATPTATLTQGAVSGLYASVTSIPPPDFLEYEYVFKRDGSTVATVLSKASTLRYEMQGAGDDGFHSWTVVIRQKDAFGQFSSTVTPSAVAFEALTLAGLRARAAYSDSNATSPDTLKGALADGIVNAGGISYAA